jgi:hypothetical protein
MIERAQSYDELSDGMTDVPTLQVYPEGGGQDAQFENDRTTFGAGIRQTDFTIFVDYYARQRSHIGEDMKALVDGIDAIQNIFEEQDYQPYFGLDGIKSWEWRWDKVTFVYGDPGLPFIGARFTVIVRVF